MPTPPSPAGKLTSTIFVEYCRALYVGEMKKNVKLFKNISAVLYYCDISLELRLKYGNPQLLVTTLEGCSKPRLLTLSIQPLG